MSFNGGSREGIPDGNSLLSGLGGLPVPGSEREATPQQQQQRPQHLRQVMQQHHQQQHQTDYVPRQQQHMHSQHAQQHFQQPFQRQGSINLDPRPGHFQPPQEGYQQHHQQQQHLPLQRSTSSSSGYTSNAYQPPMTSRPLPNSQFEHSGAPVQQYRTDFQPQPVPAAVQAQGRIHSQSQLRPNPELFQHFPPAPSLLPVQTEKQSQQQQQPQQQQQQQQDVQQAQAPNQTQAQNQSQNQSQQGFISGNSNDMQRTKYQGSPNDQYARGGGTPQQHYQPEGARGRRTQTPADVQAQAQARALAQAQNQSQYQAHHQGLPQASPHQRGPIQRHHSQQSQPGEQLPGFPAMTDFSAPGFEGLFDQYRNDSSFQNFLGPGAERDLGHNQTFSDFMLPDISSMSLKESQVGNETVGSTFFQGANSQFAQAIENTDPRRFNHLGTEQHHSEVHNQNTTQQLQQQQLQHQHRLQGHDSSTASSPFLASLGNAVSQDTNVSQLLSFGSPLQGEHSAPPPHEPAVMGSQNQPELHTIGTEANSMERERAERKAARTARFMWKPVGTMVVSPSQTGPNQYIHVQWTLPLKYVSPSAWSGGQDEHRDGCDWIGLFRARTRVDATDGFILSRDVNGRARVDTETGHVTGTIRLRTPRGVGQYNFRYFHAGAGGDNARKDTILPLARSNTVRVEVQGSDMFEALEFVQRNLSVEKKLSNATMQFATLLRQLRTLRQPLDENSSKKKSHTRNRNEKYTEEVQEAALFREVWEAVTNCVSFVRQRCDHLFRLIEEEEPLAETRREQFKVLNDYKEGLKERAFAAEGGANATPNSKADDESDEHVLSGMMSEDDFLRWKEAKDRLLTVERSLSQNLRDRATLSSSLRAVLVAFLECPCIQAILSPQSQKQVEQVLELYCPVDEVFYPSPKALLAHFESDFGMRPRHGTIDLRAFMTPSPELMQTLENDIDARLQSLIPPSSMESERYSFVDRLQKTIDQVAFSKWGCDAKLVPFGSSINMFGSVSSDLDICLVLIPRNANWPGALHEDPPSEEDGAPSAEHAVEDLASALIQEGYENVDDCRKSARIPILQFHYPALKLDCDICIDNRLAIRNTLLLRTFAKIDPRLRQLAYIIKLWAKRRNINNPSQRTLSSYGYILILIQFLQKLPVPILPPLQSLPPSWDGQEIPEESDCPIVLVQSQDGKQHNTYFYGDPQSPVFASEQAQQVVNEKLQRFAQRNTDTIGQLLIRLFWTLAFGFDWRRHVISIRDSVPVSKETKASEDSWKLHQRMAIEDPFETSYDVAHVVRDKEFRLMRREFVRAYAILAGCSTELPLSNVVDALATERLDSN